VLIPLRPDRQLGSFLPRLFPHALQFGASDKLLSRRRRPQIKVLSFSMTFIESEV
jgi:hypothetical protein